MANAHGAIASCAPLTSCPRPSHGLTRSGSADFLRTSMSRHRFPRRTLAAWTALGPRSWASGCGSPSSSPRCRWASTWASASRWSTCCAQCLIALRLAELARSRRRASARSCTTRRCWSTSAATPTRTSRRSGSATTSRSRRQVRPRAARDRGDAVSMLRLFGRRAADRCTASDVGLEFAVSGPPRPRRDDRQARAPGAARSPASSACREAVQDAVGASYEQWDGQGWPGELRGARGPARGAAGAAGRVRRGCPPGGRGRRGGGAGPSSAPASSSTRCWCAALCAHADDDPRRSRRGADLGCGDRGRARARRPADAEAVRRGAAGGRRLRRPEVAVHARARPRGGRAVRRRRRERGCDQAGRRYATPRRPWCTASAGWGCRTPSGTSPGPLGAGEWERVRLHPYLTERMLRQSPALAPLGAVAVQHRERLDGSGLPAQAVRAARLASRLASWAPPTPTSRCANRARTAPRCARRRPPRSAAGRGRPGTAGRRRRRGRARRGRAPACGDVATAPHGLTAREIDVLRLLARGLSSKEIAAQLVISPKTARNHIEHIYAKTGASNRAAASLFAVQHGLLPATDRYDRTSRRWGNCPMRPRSAPRLRSLGSTTNRLGGRHEHPRAGSSPRPTTVMIAKAERGLLGALAPTAPVGARRATSSRSAPAPAPTCPPTAPRSGRSPSPSREPPMLKRLERRVAGAAPAGTGHRAAAPAEDLPFDDDTLRHRRVHPRALRRRPTSHARCARSGVCCGPAARCCSSSTSAPTTHDARATQDRMNWLNRLVVCCDCNRPTLNSMCEAGFTVGDVHELTMPHAPSFVGPVLAGSATSPTARERPSAPARTTVQSR